MDAAQPLSDTLLGKCIHELDLRSPPPRSFCSLRGGQVLHGEKLIAAPCLKSLRNMDCLLRGRGFFPAVCAGPALCPT